MICPVCKHRWAGFPKEDFEFVAPHGRIKMFFSRITFNLIKRNGFYPKHGEAGFNRGVAFGSNEIRCCGDLECLKTVDAQIEAGVGISYDEMVKETRKELSEGKIPI